MYNILFGLLFQNILTVGTCAALPDLQNGQTNYTNGQLEGGKYPVNTVAKYICNEGYVLSGSGSNTCLYHYGSGKWTKDNPTCNEGNKMA